MPPRSPRPLGRRALVPSALNLVAIGAMTAPAIAGLPVAVDQLVPADARTGTLGLAITLGAVAATVANPLFGALSDRTRSRWGRRHPWTVGGAALGLVATVVLLLAPSVGVLIAAWVAVQISYNAMLAAAAGLLSDAVADAERSAASGAFAAAAFLGTVPPLLLSSLLPDHLDAVTLTMCIVAVGISLGAAVWLPERGGPAAEALTVGHRGASVRRFAPVWIGRFIQSVAFGLLTSFMLYLVADRITGSAASATSLTSVSTLAGGAALVGAALFGGWLAARVDRRILLGASAIVLALAAFLRAASTDAALLVVSAVTAGLAMGVFFTVNLAVALRRIPPGAGGRYLGALNVADTLPQILVPVVAAWLLTLGGPDPISSAADNFTTLCVAAAVVSLLGLVALPFLGATVPPTEVDVGIAVEDSPRREHP
ncbi:MFS transporter [Microbacterium schleiferi]|uniref:MFS transporter n=1 Tax=Microbacterium schleiferi TaxID=69362 RepID=A0A7S8MXJ3_9MICO|nr:MFS transporter [Microbacterium schleiferi]QPE05034.1 MFS transporter [Microbacterium schleiferi]